MTAEQTIHAAMTPVIRRLAQAISAKVRAGDSTVIRDLTAANTSRAN